MLLITVDIVVAWALRFESSKRRFKKGYPILALSLCHFLDFSRVVAKHGEFDDGLNVKDDEVPVELVLQAPVRVERL